MLSLKSKETFNAFFSFSSKLARSKFFSPLTYPLMQTLAFLTLKIRRANKKHDALTIAEEWQKMFPGGKKILPITEVKNDTVYAEIRMKCPLRGTGDALACHRLMEYDRTMVKNIGGIFTVVESQSNSGKEFCKVAFRRKGVE